MLETLSSLSAHPRVVVRPKLGFAGVGWIGRNRLEAIAEAQVADIAAIFDPVSEAAASARKSSPDALLAATYEDLLAADIDGVVLATPSALHAGQAIAALEAGKAVFCQKPLARTAEETRRVLDAAKSANRLAQVDLSYRHTTGMQRLRELIRSGELGRIYAIEGVFHNAYGPDKAWFYNPHLAGGGCLLDLGIHLVDLALWCLDFPGVTEVCGQLKNIRGVEHYAAGQLLLESDVSVQLACSWKVPAGCDAKIGLTFYGERGGAEFRNIDGSFYDFTAEHFLPDRSRRLLAAPPDAWGGRAAVAWAQQLAVSAEWDPEIEHLHTVAQTLDRLYGRDR